MAAMDAVNANARRVHLEMAAAYEKLVGVGREQRRTEQPRPEQVSEAPSHVWRSAGPGRRRGELEEAAVPVSSRRW